MSSPESSKRTVKTPAEGECYHYDGEGRLQMYARNDGEKTEYAIQKESGRWVAEWAPPDWEPLDHYLGEVEQVPMDEFPTDEAIIDHDY